MIAGGKQRPPTAATGTARRHATGATLNLAIAPLVTKDWPADRPAGHLRRRHRARRTGARLVQADKLSSIGLLAAGVAHEVNTPLAVISTYAQMLAKQVARRRAEEQAAGQDRQADVPRQRDRQLAAELLPHLVHRLCRGGSEPVSARRCRCWSTSSRRRDSGRPRDFAEPCRPIRGNAGKLQQVFLNLFLNARDAMSESAAARCA
jgi:two-component system, NtrC family, sensor kinase